ncbi:cytochrome d ubiquinol oxidase subunit II [Botryobacter ruber]|uniref:cytochrome d ubiquinol oxidase subunit II n=1 Tax=Botryobacter ruber TaxID=2171629 RepID=UPI000E0A6986|nr:cytochrome d ubiquinol oxidase subunit II [Botryobacter ruber]
METFLNIDYPTWWFLVMGGVFTGYAILDGFDLGAGALHLFFRKEQSRRIALNAIGPVWDGNEVWLVIGAGVLFAGFPKVYASVFSAFYLPFMLFLMMIILRAISIEFRSKEPMAWWRRMWDVSYSLSSATLGFLLGLILGNLLQGIPIDKEGNFTGHWLYFLNPYAIMVGITTLALFMMHGAIYLVMKTEDRLYAKLTILVRNTTIFFSLCVILLTMYTLIYIPQLTNTIRENQWLFLIPALMVLAVANITRQITKRRYIYAFVSSGVTLALLLILVAVELYPSIVVSTLDPAYTLTVYNSAASTKSLGIMLTFAAIGVPLVAIYTTFVFWTFKGKVKLDEASY